MIRGLVIRPVEQADHEAVASLLEAAFGGADESRLVEALRRDGDVELELAATHEGTLVAHVLYSRLRVDGGGDPFDAVALAPLAVQPNLQRSGVGTALVEHAHPVLRSRGERLSVVLGDANYYGRFGYDAARAAGFESEYAGLHLQALAWGEAPTTGRLVYPRAFSGL